MPCIGKKPVTPILAEWQVKVWNLMLMYKLSAIVEHKLNNEHAMAQFQDIWCPYIEKGTRPTNNHYNGRYWIFSKNYVCNIFEYNQ